MKLFNFNRSSSAWRVRIALALKKVDVEVINVDISLETRAQDQPEYAEVNPLRQVPCLEWENNGTTHRLAQSVAIIEWLEHRHPSPPLLPTGANEAANVREMVQIVNAGVQPLQNNRVLAQINSIGGNDQDWAKFWIDKGLVALEARAQKWSGRYLFGDSITMADIFLVPQLSNARRFGVDENRLSTLVRVDRLCALHPAFTAAQPEPW